MQPSLCCLPWSPFASSPHSASIQKCGWDERQNQIPRWISTRDFILNTFEQFTAYLVAIAVVALYSPPEGARALPILTALFVLGRILFWVGYHKHPYLRAFGFGITFYPTVAVYIWFVLLIVFGIRIPLF